MEHPLVIDYVCPRCKGALEGLHCSNCAIRYPEVDGVPNFLTVDASLPEVADTSANYDSIYTEHADVWEDQGRGKPFREFFAAVAAELAQGNVLEIGCGEGFLLQAMHAQQKWGVDISPRALQGARRRSGAHCATAVAEMLPHPTASMDLIASVGVLEHLLDPDKAHAEVLRVLKPGGHYVVLIHVKMTVAQRLVQKVRELLFPPRPVRLYQWAKKKLYRPIRQPSKNLYTPTSAAAAIEKSGLTIQRIISKASDAAAPLAGPHVFIYVCRKT